MRYLVTLDFVVAKMRVSLGRPGGVPPLHLYQSTLGLNTAQYRKALRFTVLELDREYVVVQLLESLI
jgi:hypothetical protein